MVAYKHTAETAAVVCENSEQQLSELTASQCGDNDEDGSTVDVAASTMDETIESTLITPLNSGPTRLT